MEKSIYKNEYKIFLQLLRSVRDKAGITQEELAVKLNTTQSFISKCERGERRIDIVEAYSFCKALGHDFSKFSEELLILIRN